MGKATTAKTWDEMAEQEGATTTEDNTKTKKAESISNMIYKECRRNSLTELCEEWGVTTEEFDVFMSAGKQGFSKNEEGN